MRKDAYEAFILSVDNVADRVGDIARRLEDRDRQALLSMLPDLEKVDGPAVRRAGAVVELVGSDRASALSADVITKVADVITKLTAVVLAATKANANAEYVSALDEFHAARSAFVSLVRKELGL